MVGEGRMLAVVYHRSPPVGDSQLLGFMLWLVLDNGSVQQLAHGDVPMAPLAQLAWIGFSTSHVRAVVCRRCAGSVCVCVLLKRRLASSGAGESVVALRHRTPHSVPHACTACHITTAFRAVR
jgi:hypothetical protein